MLLALLVVMRPYSQILLEEGLMMVVVLMVVVVVVVLCMLGMLGTFRRWQMVMEAPPLVVAVAVAHHPQTCSWQPPYQTGTAQF